MTFHEVLQSLIKFRGPMRIAREHLGKGSFQPGVAVASAVIAPNFQNHKADLTQNDLFHFIL